MLSTALQRHHTENSKQIIPGKELPDYSSNFYIHVSVSDSSDWSACSAVGKYVGANVGIYRLLTDT
jgi:hypothetical protein